MVKGGYQYFQPNEKDLKDKYGDCVIRALCAATQKRWVEIFDGLVCYAREHQCMPNSKPAYQDFLTHNGFVYVGVSNKKGTKRPTVQEFAKAHKDGVYVLRVAHHLVACRDGVYLDTWNSGCKSLYGYWERV